MKTIALYSLKGGVGKTAAAVNLAYEAAQSGKHVLLWDLDPQGAASWYYGIDESPEISAKRVVSGKEPLGRYIQPTDYERLSILPGDRGYRDWDAQIHAAKQPRKVLENLIEPFSESYSLLVLDCPPGIGALATSVLRAADRVLVPVVPTPLSLRALDEVLEHVDDKKVGKTRKRGVQEETVAISGGSGHNLQAVIADLEKRMRDAAANLEFEEAARLRDELKKLREENLDLIG